MGSAASFFPERTYESAKNVVRSHFFLCYLCFLLFNLHQSPSYPPLFPLLPPVKLQRTYEAAKKVVRSPFSLFVISVSSVTSCSTASVPQPSLLSLFPLLSPVKPHRSPSYLPPYNHDLCSLYGLLLNCSELMKQQRKWSGPPSPLCYLCFPLPPVKLYLSPASGSFSLFLSLFPLLPPVQLHRFSVSCYLLFHFSESLLQCRILLYLSCHH